MNKKICYISPIRHFAQKTPWTDVHQIRHSCKDRRRNDLWQIFWWSLKGCRFCIGSRKISHWQSQWPL